MGNIFRNDRSDGYNMVVFFLPVEVIYSVLSLPLTLTTCEVIACEVKCNNCNPLIVVYVYRPPHRDLLYMQNLCSLLEEIITSHFDCSHCTIWLTGDLNLPDIDWNRLSISSYQYPLTINNYFLNLIGYGGFTQLVDTPTRDNRMLEIFATN